MTTELIPKRDSASLEHEPSSDTPRRVIPLAEIDQSRRSTVETHGLANQDIEHILNIKSVLIIQVI